jgi:uncharacterized metal-binding protein YceD (DUF177 family)
VSVPGLVDVELVLPADGAVVVSGRLDLRFEVPCGRCLDPAAVDGGTALSATYLVGRRLPDPSGPLGSDDDEDGRGLSDEDLDAWLFDGSVLRLDELVVEQVRLAYPMRALCCRGEACRGLCSHCGDDLNAQDPGASRRCARCGQPVGASVDGMAESTQSASGGGEGPLARALKKLQLPD